MQEPFDIETGLLVLGDFVDAVLPEPGMNVMVRCGRRQTPGVIESVQATGRRLIVKPTTSDRTRGYTQRDDGIYRLEGAPDSTEVLLEFDQPIVGEDMSAWPDSPSGRPIHLRKLRRSPQSEQWGKLDRVNSGQTVGAAGVQFPRHTRPPASG